MDRREAITKVGWLLGGTIVGANLFLDIACTPAAEKSAAKTFFNADQIALLDEMGETILPATSTPGAKASKIGEFMDIMVRDCYTKADQKIFKDGLVKLEDECKKEHGKSFMDSSAAERTAFFIKKDAEQKEYMKTKKPEDPSHHFRMIKELTLLGFFTSEVGATKALRYVSIPGKYDGNVPYKKGDKAWAT
ncbi:MAG: gluconate 2-dehydrogenase subunit 3 family protein [Flavobacterium sp.]|nr:gluconate 2-dehydrogenase subunit 3 family protein [Pedobacter sp.]